MTLLQLRYIVEVGILYFNCFNETVLKDVSGDKKVVLGLITTKSPKLEDQAAVIARIREAAEIVPLERVYLCPQCGFAFCRGFSGKLSKPVKM